MTEDTPPGSLTETDLAPLRRQSSATLSLESSDSPRGPPRTPTPRGSVAAEEAIFVQQHIRPEFFVLDGDPWNVQLVPQEPSPKDFDTFVDFEAALKRWASVVSQLQFIPPNAKQLNELAPIAVAQEASGKNVDDSNLALPPQPKKVGLVTVDFWETKSIPSLSLRDLVVPHIPLRQRLQKSHRITGKKLGFSATASLSACLDKMLNRRQVLLQVYNLPNEPVVPRIKGTLTPTDLVGPRLDRNYTNNILRRADLAESYEIASHDCPPKVHGRTVEFFIPEHDLAELDYTRLWSERQYLAEKKDLMVALKYKHVQDDLNSWFYPKKSPKIHSKLRADAESRFKQKKNEFKVDLLGDNDQSDEGGVAQYGQHLYANFNAETLPKILALFDTYSSPIKRRNIATFIFNGLQNNKSKAMLEALCEKDKLHSLSLLAYSMTLHADVPKDLFPYRDDIVQSAIEAIGRKYASIIRNVYIYYYLGCIHTVAEDEPFLFVAVNTFIQAQRKLVANQLASQLRENPEFLRKVLFKHIGHRSSSISAVLLFVAVQLMHDNVASDDGLKKVITFEIAEILADLKALSYSKLSHARFACRRLLTILKTDEWIDVIFSKFTSSKDYVNELIDPKLPKQSEYAQHLIDVAFIGLERARSIVAEIQMGQLNVVAIAKLNPVAFLLSTSVFRALVEACVKSSNKVDARTADSTRVISAISKTFWMLRRIKLGSGHTNGNDYTLTLTTKDISNILQFLKNAKGEERYANLSLARMLMVVRHLSKDNAIFDHLKTDTEYHAIISGFCKRSTFQVSKQAWMLFYQMIYYHPGAAELFVKQKFISGYLDILGATSALPLMQFGLRYLGKLLAMRPPAKKEKKDPDVKALTNYIISIHLFIKIHMIYKKLIEDAPGGAFSELVAFYHIVLTSPNCSKWLKDISKSPEFKDGLNRMRELTACLDITTIMASKKAVRESIIAANMPSLGPIPSPRGTSPRGPSPRGMQGPDSIVAKQSAASEKGGKKKDKDKDKKK